MKALSIKIIVIFTNNFDEILKIFFRSSIGYIKNCDVIDIPQAIAKIKTGFPFQKNSPYLKIFNRKIKDLKEKGILSKIINKHRLTPRNCQTSSATTIDVEDCFTAYLIWACGLVLGLLFLMVEKSFIDKKKRSRINETDKELSYQDLKELLEEKNCHIELLKIQQENMMHTNQELLKKLDRI